MNIDPNTLIALIFAHKWFAAVSLVAWAVVRLLREDARVLPNLSGKWRDLIALTLAACAGGADAIVLGKTLKEAAAGAAVVFVVAIMGQYVPIFRVLKRDGGGSSSSSGVAAAGLALLVCAGLLGGADACTPKQVKDVHDVNEVAAPVVQQACTTLEVMTNSGGVKVVCLIAEEISQLVSNIFRAHAEAGARSAAEQCRLISADGVSVCATDAELTEQIDLIEARKAARRKRDAGR